MAVWTTERQTSLSNGLRNLYGPSGHGHTKKTQAKISKRMILTVDGRNFAPPRHRPRQTGEVEMLSGEAHPLPPDLTLGLSCDLRSAQRVGNGEPDQNKNRTATVLPSKRQL